jgi:phenylacetate-CoA ligase
LATITQVKTKWEDILTTPDGRFISPSVLTHPFKPVKGIEKSQIIQEDLDHVLVKLVATPQFDSAQRALLLHGLRERLGSETAVDVELVSDIPKERSGKYRWVISKVPFAFNESMAKLSPEVASHG